MAAEYKKQSFYSSSDEITEYGSIDGNYTEFYTQVNGALSGGKWPVSTDEALAVARIIDQAREVSFR